MDDGRPRSLRPAPRRVAIAQIGMHWTTQENTPAIARALRLAHAEGASICGFSELAITGFHRQIAREAVPETVAPALGELQGLCARLSIAAAVGAPTFGGAGARFISHLLIDERGEVCAGVAKKRLTPAEAAFFHPGAWRWWSLPDMAKLARTAVARTRQGELLPY